MKAATLLYKSAHYSKAFQWLKLISITGIAQIGVQAIGLVSGILIIRLLPTQEYALYTLTNTMLGTMTVLADGGISTGVMAQGGKVWQNKEKLGVVIVTGFELRKKFAVISLIISIPILLYLLQQHSASLLLSILIVVSIIPSYFMTLSGTLLQIGPRLHQDIVPLQKNQAKVSIYRLLLLTSTIFVLPWSFIAILSAGLPQIWSNRNLRKISLKYIDWNQVPDKQIRLEILTFVKRLLPAAIYYCVSGQITLWIISIVGNTDSIAKVGALGRLSVVISLLSVIFSTLVCPRFARLSDKSQIILKRYLQIQAGILLLTILIICFVSLFPSEVLWILGKKYANLEHELVLNIAGSCFTQISIISNSLYTSRGWVMNPIMGIPIGISVIIIAALITDLSSLDGALNFNLIIGGMSALINGSYGLFKIKQLDWKARL